MTHNEMIAKLKAGMTLVSGGVESKIVNVERQYDDANKTTYYAVKITNEQGQTVGSEQLFDLIFNRKVITIKEL
ncbi:MAG: hypothetical protein GY847_28780 [Proteobacteria bacterium]|nr:hypothetical protein [Pseudomonadota bacterium]